MAQLFNVHAAKTAGDSAACMSEAHCWGQRDADVWCDRLTLGRAQGAEGHLLRSVHRPYYVGRVQQKGLREFRYRLPVEGLYSARSRVGHTAELRRVLFAVDWQGGITVVADTLAGFPVERLDDAARAWFARAGIRAGARAGKAVSE